MISSVSSLFTHQHAPSGLQSALHSRDGKFSIDVQVARQQLRRCERMELLFGFLRVPYDSFHSHTSQGLFETAREGRCRRPYDPPRSREGSSTPAYGESMLALPWPVSSPQLYVLAFTRLERGSRLVRPPPTHPFITPSSYGWAPHVRPPRITKGTYSSSLPLSTRCGEASSKTNRSWA